MSMCCCCIPSVRMRLVGAGLASSTAAVNSKYACSLALFYNRSSSWREISSFGSTWCSRKCQGVEMGRMRLAEPHFWFTDDFSSGRHAHRGAAYPFLAFLRGFTFRSPCTINAGGKLTSKRTSWCPTSRYELCIVRTCSKLRQSEQDENEHKFVWAIDIEWSVSTESSVRM